MNNKSRSYFNLFFVLLIGLAFIGCPPKKPPKARPPREVRKPAEVYRPAPPPAVITPQRKASQRTVQKGITDLNAENYEQALQTFQDAVNIDPSNGVAYYYLAMANNHLEEKETALGLLDKAEALLQYEPEWIEKIEELRLTISGEAPETAPLPPVVDEF